MASSGERELTHDELWDDSAMIDTWNIAQKEYEIYHSISAKGERIQDILGSSNHQGKSEVAAGTQNTAASALHPTAAPAYTNQNQHEPEPNVDSNAPQPLGEAEKGHSRPLNASLTASIPEALLARQDENMKNLMMSWYYAGYYTGLHEGQQMSQPMHSPSKEQ